jgi:hypothetical protein
VGGSPGTYRRVPRINSSVTRQFAWINASRVALYNSAIFSSVSPACILIGDHPNGGGQLDGGGGRVAVGMSVGCGVADGVRVAVTLKADKGEWQAVMTPEKKAAATTMRM